MKSMSQKVPDALHDNEAVLSQRFGDRDEDELARTGKKQVLRVRSHLVCSLQNTIIDDDSGTLVSCPCWDSAVLC